MVTARCIIVGIPLVAFPLIFRLEVCNGTGWMRNRLQAAVFSVFGWNSLDSGFWICQCIVFNPKWPLDDLRGLNQEMLLENRVWLSTEFGFRIQLILERKYLGKPTWAESLVVGRFALNCRINTTAFLRQARYIHTVCVELREYPLLLSKQTFKKDCSIVKKQYIYIYMYFSFFLFLSVDIFKRVS